MLAVNPGIGKVTTSIIKTATRTEEVTKYMFE